MHDNVHGPYNNVRIQVILAKDIQIISNSEKHIYQSIQQVHMIVVEAKVTVME